MKISSSAKVDSADISELGARSWKIGSDPIQSEAKAKQKADAEELQTGETLKTWRAPVPTAVDHGDDCVKTKSKNTKLAHSFRCLRCVGRLC